MATQKLSSFHPRMVILDCQRPRRIVRIAQIPQRIAHDQQTGHPLSLRTRLHLLQIVLVTGPAKEERIDIFDAFNAEPAGGFCKIQVIKFTPEDRVWIFPEGSFKAQR